MPSTVQSVVQDGITRSIRVGTSPDSTIIAAGTMPVDDSLNPLGVAGNPLFVRAPGGAATAVQTATAGSSLVLKNSAGLLLTVYVTTGATGGFLMIYDAAAVPADGTVSPRDCVYCPPNGTTSLDSPPMLAQQFANGIVAVFSTTGPFTQTTTSATAFIKGIVQ